MATRKSSSTTRILSGRGASALRRRLDTARGIGAPARGSTGSHSRDGGAVAELALDGDGAARLLGEAAHHGEAEAGALADALGGEERLGGVREGLRVHARAGVGDGEADIAAGRQVGRRLVTVLRVGGDGQPAAIGHGVPGIDREIEDGELELVGVDQHRAQAELDPAFRSRSCGPSERARRSVMPSTSVARSTGSGFSSWRRAKASMRWVSEAPRWAPCMALSIRRSELRVVGQALAQQLEAADDRHQQIVEVVGDAAGQPADGLHLLALQQFLLGPRQGQCGLAALGQIARDLGEADEIASVVADRDR